MYQYVLYILAESQIVEQSKEWKKAYTYTKEKQIKKTCGSLHNENNKSTSYIFFFESNIQMNCATEQRIFAFHGPNSIFPCAQIHNYNIIQIQIRLNFHCKSVHHIQCAAYIFASTTKFNV